MVQKAGTINNASSANCCLLQCDCLNIANSDHGHVTIFVSFVLSFGRRTTMLGKPYLRGNVTQLVTSVSGISMTEDMWGLAARVDNLGNSIDATR